LAFLLADHRRFYLGSIEDHSGTTIRVISAVSDHWSEDEILDFERTIWAFNPPVPDHLHHGSASPEDVRPEGGKWS
jgi:hypothetical protein